MLGVAGPTAHTIHAKSSASRFDDSAFLGLYLDRPPAHFFLTRTPPHHSAPIL